MGFVLLVAGLLMIVTGAKGTYSQFGQQVVSDFTGPGNFTYWIAALGAVGSLGYIDSLRTFSRLFMTLIILGMLLSNRGFFAKLTEALKNGPVAPNMPAQQASGASDPAAALTSNSQGVGGSDPGGGVMSAETQGKANRWINWLFGTGTNTPATAN